MFAVGWAVSLSQLAATIGEMLDGVTGCPLDAACGPGPGRIRGGVLVGFPGVSLLMDTVAQSQGFGPLSPLQDGLGLALPLPAVVVLAIIGAFIPAYRASRVSVVDSLRYE